MKSKLNIFLIFLLLGSSSATFAQGKIDLSGVFVDGLTGEYLPTKIIAYVQGQAFEVGSTDTSNKYYFQITTRIEEIEFQSEGYKTVKLPVIFHGKFERFSKAEISIQTFKRKARFRTEDLVIFCYSTDFCKDKEYEWHVLDSTGYSVRINFGNSFKNDTNSVSVKRTLEYLPQGKFEIRDSSSVLESRIYKTTVGLNFVDTNTYFKCDETPKSQNFIDFNKQISLDKNNREVSEQGKSDLDSLLSYIIHHPKSKIAIIGLFDTQGIYETNVTSAIFSAKVVGNYLKTNGFNDDRIILFWDFKNNINSKGESPSKDGFSESPKVEVLVLND